MGVGSLRAILSKLNAQLSSPLVLFLMFAFVSFLTITGAFGIQDSMGVLERALYFGVCVVCATILGLALKISIRHFWPDLKRWQTALAVSVGVSFIYTPFLWKFADVMTSHHRAYVTPIEVMYVNIFYASMIVLLAGDFLKAQFQKCEQPRLFKRFSNSDVKQVHRVSVRNHYVDVFTDCGVETLLMRFCDAVDELDGVKGEKVHRSHWVSYDAMDRLEKQDGKVFLILTDGSKVPVSRSNRPQVERRLA